MKSFSILVLASVVGVGCAQPLKLTADDSKTVLAHQLLDAPNPADRGPYTVFCGCYCVCKGQVRIR